MYFPTCQIFMPENVFLFYTAVNKSTDYQNYFQGLWDCTGDQPDELSFRRGDTIYILSKV